MRRQRRRQSVDIVAVDDVDNATRLVVLKDTLSFDQCPSSFFCRRLCLARQTEAALRTTKDQSWHKKYYSRHYGKHKIFTNIADLR